MRLSMRSALSIVLAGLEDCPIEIVSVPGVHGFRWELSCRMTTIFISEF